MTLLASVNRLRELSREEAISAFSANQLDHQTFIGLLNDAANEILNTHRWSFLKRYDGFAFFPAKFSVTTGGIFTNGSTAVVLNVGSTSNAWDTGDVNDFTTNVRAKIRPTGSDEFSDTSFILTNLNTDISKGGTISAAYEGTTVSVADGAWEVYAHEYVLPATVRRVLDAWDQEGDTCIHFLDRDQRETPQRPTDWYSDRVYQMSVGGYFESTTKNSGTATKGEGITIWPPPDTALYLQYSYLYRFANLSAETDEWTGVPQELVTLIQNVAFEKALDSNVEDDHERASRWHVKNQRMLGALLSVDQKDPNRRMVTPEIGTSGNSANPYRRWASREVPSP